MALPPIRKRCTASVCTLLCADTLYAFMPGLRTFMPGLHTYLPGLRTFMPGLRTFMPGLCAFMPGLLTFMPGLAAGSGAQVLACASVLRSTTQYLCTPRAAPGKGQNMSAACVL